MADTLSDDALIQLFAYDAHAALALHEVSVRAAAGLRVHDLAYASPGGGSLTAFLVVPAGPGPFAGTSSSMAWPKTSMVSHLAANCCFPMPSILRQLAW